MPRHRRVAVAIAAALLLLTGCNLEQDVASKPLSSGPGTGNAAPELRGPLVDGPAFDLAAERGHPVVVDFYASWCGPCQHQQPELNAIATRYAGRVTLVGVDMQESAAEVRGYDSSLAVPYHSLIDMDGSLASAYGVPAPPTTVVVDKRGRVAATFFGNITAATLGPVLDRVLGS